MDLGYQPLPVQRLEQCLDRHLFHFIRLADADDAKVRVFHILGLAVLHQSTADFV